MKDELLDGYAPLLRLGVRHFRGDDEGLAAWVMSLPEDVVDRLKADWWWQAHGGQREPKGDWAVWLLMAGRGFGKTRAGAEWISARAREVRDARIALVGGSRDDVVKVMIEGPSGLIRVAHAHEEIEWRPSLNTLRFASGAKAFVYSAEAPEALRGPEHHFAWADELAKWSAHGADRAWDNLMMGLRQGERPRCVVTTTPKTVPLLKRVKVLAGTEATYGKTDENAHLPDAFVAWMRETYAGTRLGRQELDGELIEEVEGALLSRGVLGQDRPRPSPASGRGAVQNRRGGGPAGFDRADARHRRLRERRGGRAKRACRRERGWRYAGAVGARGGGGGELGRGPGHRREEPGRGHGAERAEDRRAGPAGHAREREQRQIGARGAGGGAVRERAGKARRRIPEARGRARGASDRRRLCRARTLARQGGRVRLGDDCADEAAPRGAPRARLL